MRDANMSDAGGVSVQLATDPFQKNISLFDVPFPTNQLEADMYTTLKKLQRDLEFLSLQEVLPSSSIIVIRIYILIL
jgi:hypothetical protein